MTINEIKILILRRAYAHHFSDGLDDIFSLHKLADENGIDHEEAWNVFDELKDAGLIKSYGSNAMIGSTTKGLLYAEKHELADRELIDKQNEIRKKLLVELAEIQERTEYGRETDWERLIQIAGVSEEDFQNNDRLLRDLDLMENPSLRGYRITRLGMERVADYRNRKRRLDEFGKLENLDGVTAQQRGHELEDLLARTAEWEGWEVQRRVRAQGQENDIIMHVGMHYFLSSCKWEAELTQPNEVELLESRVRSRATTNGGILFSMSGFTDNCIKEIKLKIATALVIPFGPADIRRIMQSEATLTNLLDDKIDQVMNHRLILVDGELK